MDLWRLSSIRSSYQHAQVLVISRTRADVVDTESGEVFYTQLECQINQQVVADRRECANDI